MKPRTVGLILVALLLAAFPGGAVTPSVTNIDFPSIVPNDTTAQGQISFRGFSADIAKAEFFVADGRYEPVTMTVDEANTRNERLRFELPCTDYAQQITLAVRLVDEAGMRNAPREFSFTCGEPPRYNLQSELSEELPVRQRVPVNVFILDDGATTVSEGAIYGERSPLGMPRQAVVQAIYNRVAPALSGVWDQCGLGLELNGAWVVQPEEIQVSGRPLSEQIYDRGEDGNRVIRYSGQTDELMRKATFELWQAAQRQTQSAFRGYNVVLVGTPIEARWQGEWSAIEGFSGGTWPKFAVARWGALLEGVRPKQMLATLAHELGHNFGLEHPGNSSVAAVAEDDNNLMKGSGVAPEPRANLLPGQCDRVHQTLTKLQEQLANAQ